MFGTQVSAIWYDETGIEALKKEEARYVMPVFDMSLVLPGAVNKRGQFPTVLWIRIRKNPKILAGSESGIRKKFGFGSRHYCKIKIFVKNRRSKT
jgi:hypothetical protein